MDEFSARARYGWPMSNSDRRAPDRDARLALLHWYREMGVDAAVCETSVNWPGRGGVAPLDVAGLLPAAARSPSPPVAASADPAPGTMARSKPAGAGRSAAAAPVAGHDARQHRGFIPTAPDAAEADARQAAQVATTIAALNDALARFDGCGLKATAKNLCFYRGGEHARVMVIGEAPGRDEDRSGVPFVGRAGQLLDKMLAAIALDDGEVHITNVVYWRPPGNRTPTPQEVLACRPFLERQIELVAPQIIVTVGGPAAKAILNVAQGIMKTRGKWGRFGVAGGAPIRVMPTLHPAYLLRTPAAKRLAWRDLLAVREALDND